MSGFIPRTAGVRVYEAMFHRASVSTKKPEQVCPDLTRLHWLPTLTWTFRCKVQISVVTERISIMLHLNMFILQYNLSFLTHSSGLLRCFYFVKHILSEVILKGSSYGYKAKNFMDILSSDNFNFYNSVIESLDCSNYWN